MSIVNGKRLIDRYESGGDAAKWTDDEKELLIFALYCVYRSRAKDGVTLAFEIEESRQRINKLRQVLSELHCLVWGESPGLLNEDSGGNSQLDSEIRELLGEEAA